MRVSTGLGLSALVLGLLGGQGCSDDNVQRPALNIGSGGATGGSGGASTAMGGSGGTLMAVGGSGGSFTGGSGGEPATGGVNTGGSGGSTIGGANTGGSGGSGMGGANTGGTGGSNMSGGTGGSDCIPRAPHQVVLDLEGCDAAKVAAVFEAGKRCEGCHFNSNLHTFHTVEGLNEVIGKPINDKPLNETCMNRTVVIPGNAEESSLYIKLTNTPEGCGAPMPKPQGKQCYTPLSADELKCVADWINSLPTQ